MASRRVHHQADLSVARVRLPGVFSPSSPVTQLNLLAGRHEQIRQVIGAVGQVGQHVVLYGERGVGKTSLASLVHVIWAGAFKDSDSLVAARAQCDADDTFESMWQKVATAIDFEFTKKGIKGSAAWAYEETSAVLSSGGATPAGVVRLFGLIDKKCIVMLDEFDRIVGYEAARRMADTIKALSDFALDVTVILVGVADSVDGLIKEHLSIDRCLVQVLMPRMSIAELGEIVTTRLNLVDMAIAPQALLRIAAFSQGFPHYAHLFGLHAGLHAVERRESREVTSRDVDAALQKAVNESQQSVLNAYARAVSSPQPGNLFRETLLACAMTKVDDLGYFAPADVRQPMTQIMREQREIPSFVKHLSAFTKSERGGVLQRVGGSHTPRFRFTNPLLRPYVVFRGVEEGLVKEAGAYQHSEPEVARQLSLFTAVPSDDA